MQAASPTRLYATVLALGLFAFGIAGFFHDASFADPGGASEALGLFAVNGWANSFHVITGALGLLVAGFAARPYAIWLSAVYVVVAVFA